MAANSTADLPRAFPRETGADDGFSVYLGGTRSKWHTEVRESGDCAVRTEVCGEWDAGTFGWGGVLLEGRRGEHERGTEVKTASGSGYGCGFPSGGQGAGGGSRRPLAWPSTGNHEVFPDGERGAGCRRAGEAKAVCAARRLHCEKHAPF
jgi:hypothetical protein